MNFSLCDSRRRNVNPLPAFVDVRRQYQDALEIGEQATLQSLSATHRQNSLRVRRSTSSLILMLLGDARPGFA